jgi:hypothetical protein
MAKIVKLAALLPEDIVFELPGGERYTFPGDPPLELILKIAALFERAESDDGELEAVGIEILRELDDQVLSLMRMRDPEVAESPFGVIGVQHVVAELLKAYNFGEEEPADDTDPPKRKTAPRKSRSSSGSRSS